MPIEHTVHLKEEYEYVKMVLELFKYEHKRIIYVDPKMVDMLLGQHGGYTQFICFIC